MAGHIPVRGGLEAGAAAGALEAEYPTLVLDRYAFTRRDVVAADEAARPRLVT